MEDSPFSWGAVGPHSSTVATHDSFDSGQSETASWEFSLGMEALEGSENSLTVGLFEADPIVSYIVDTAIRLVLFDAQLDPGTIARSGVLPGILQQVGQENPYERLVPDGHD